MDLRFPYYHGGIIVYNKRYLTIAALSLAVAAAISTMGSVRAESGINIKSINPVSKNKVVTVNEAIADRCSLGNDKVFITDDCPHDLTLNDKAEKAPSAIMQITETKKDKPYYPLTAKERRKIEQVTMASCGDFGYNMAKANAQVILNRLESKRFGLTVDDVLSAPKQFEVPSKTEATADVKKAVSAVFDKGEKVSGVPIYYYVNPNISAVKHSTWKKGKAYVMTVGKGHYIHEYWTDKIA